MALMANSELMLVSEKCLELFHQTNDLTSYNRKQ